MKFIEIRTGIVLETENEDTIQQMKKHPDVYGEHKETKPKAVAKTEGK